MSMDNEGTLSWLPTTAGNYPVTVSITDDCAATTTRTYVLVVLDNAPPHLFANAPRRGPQGSLFSIDFDPYEANVDDQLTFSIASGPSGATIDPETGILQWVANDTGRYGIEVVACR
jgi:hypothetical protein